MNNSFPSKRSEKNFVKDVYVMSALVQDARFFEMMARGFKGYMPALSGALSYALEDRVNRLHKYLYDEPDGLSLSQEQKMMEVVDKSSAMLYELASILNHKGNYFKEIPHKPFHMPFSDRNYCTITDIKRSFERNNGFLNQLEKHDDIIDLVGMDKDKIKEIFKSIESMNTMAYRTVKGFPAKSTLSRFVDEYSSNPDGYPLIKTHPEVLFDCEVKNAVSNGAIAIHFTRAENNQIDIRPIYSGSELTMEQISTNNNESFVLQTAKETSPSQNLRFNYP